MSALSDEITNDPQGHGYAGLTDQQVADILNTTLDRSRNKTILTGDEVFSVTNPTEWTGLLPASKTLWMSFCGRTTIDPFGSANVAFVQSIFGGGSTTVSNLVSLRVETGLSWVRLSGWQGSVNADDVASARA